MTSTQVTKVLFFDNDETSFQFRQCMARVLNQIPPVELLHAKDATEALKVLDASEIDVVVIDADIKDELEFFLENLKLGHPPIVLRTDTKPNPADYSVQGITFIKKNESLAGVHQTLLIAATVAAKSAQPEAGYSYH